MTVNDIKRLIRECIEEIESESPTGMLAVNIAEAPPSQSAKYTELAKVVDYVDPQPLQLIKMKGPSAAIDYLVSQLSHYQPRQLPSPPWQSTDKTFDRGDYVLYWNETSNYVGLVQVGEDLQEMSTTGGVAGYMTPNAFGTKGSTGSTKALAASVGFKKAVNPKKNTTTK
jgi:hypothetical protein